MFLLCWIITGYMVAIVLRIIGSWLNLEGSGAIGTLYTIAYGLTEPVFVNVRRVIPVPEGLPLDLAPMIVFFVLGFVRTIVCHL